MSNYRANVNKANPTTLRLLEKTLDKLGNLIENVDEIEDGRNETIIFSIDESKFDVKRSIFCRICKVCHAFCYHFYSLVYTKNIGGAIFDEPVKVGHKFT